ncbi:MAG: hypothetical protein V1789_08805 [PVC group bacterium]
MESSLDRDTVTVGDPVRYTLRVTAPPGAEVSFPAYGDGMIGGFEIGETGEGTAEEGGERVWDKWFILQGFDIGKFPLPGASVTIRFPGKGEEQLESSPLEITVKSVLESSPEEADIRGIKPPVGLPVSYRWVLYLIGGILLLAALVLLLIKKVFRRKPKAVPAPPPRPPHEVAYEQLRRIKEENLPGRGLIREYYTGVSDVVRRYLENRFGLRAPERTTEEFLHDMASTDFLTVPQQDLVGAFLGECDMVKFARYGPTEKEIDGVYDAAIRLVDETKEEKRESTAEVQRLTSDNKITTAPGGFIPPERKFIS